MKLVVGLGNPGSQYSDTRHNAGFMLLESRYLSGPLQEGQGRWKSAHKGLIRTLTLGGRSVVFLRPMTYMNMSGQAVLAAMRFYHLPLENLLVVVDDAALPCGAVRLRAGGSSGGHNGLGDIERALANLAAREGKTGRDYARLRIGIGAPGATPLETYVLRNFSVAQRRLIESALLRAAEAVECWVSLGITQAMNRYNSRQ